MEIGLKQVKKTNTYNILTIILLVFFVVSFGILCGLNIFRYTAFMDADVASEAVLAREIAENGMRIPKTWVTSTETRIFYPLNLAALFYSVFHDMNLSMGIACSLCALLIVLSMLLLFKKLGYKTLPIIVALAIPFMITDNYHDALEMYILFAGYYFSVIFIDFILLYFYAVFIEKGATFPLLVVSVIAAVVLGIQGMRGFLMVFIPLIMSEFLRQLVLLIKYRKFGSLKGYFPLIWAVLTGGISFVVSKAVAVGMTSTSRNIRGAAKKLIFEVVPSLTRLVTTVSSKTLWMLATVLYVIAFGYMIIRIVKRGSVDDAGLWCNLQLWMSFFTMLLAMTFTTSDVSARYSIFLVFATASTLGLMLTDKTELVGGRNIYTLVIVIVIVCGIFSGVSNACRLSKEKRKMEVEYENVASYMQKQGVKKGYATFDQANITTVMANDNVRVCAVDSLEKMNGCKWLSNASWYPPYSVEEGAVAVITSESTDGDFKAFMTNNTEYEILSSQSYETLNCYIVDKDPAFWEE